MNEIKLNKIGIEIISGDPQIFRNKIDKNFENGILTTSYNGLRCFATKNN
jgi:F-box protein 11